MSRRGEKPEVMSANPEDHDVNETLVSVVIPVFNEEDNIERAYRAIVKEFAGLGPGYAFEVIFTDNHSTDRTFELLKALVERDPRVRAFRFSRNYGYQKSLLFGYLNARGQCAIQLDCDLQDPPSLFPDMLRLWRRGNAVVYGVRRSRQEGGAITACRHLFYRLISALSEDNLPLDAGDFRLVDRCVLDQLRVVDDASPYLRGLISSMGFNQVGLPYDRAARTAGESKFGLMPMLKLAIDGVVNHSMVPLRIASLTGLLLAVLTLVGTGVYVAGKFVFGQDWPAGFATTTVLLLLSITLNAIFLGVIGEYLGRIYLQTKRRPLVIVEQQLNASVIPLGATGSQ